MKNLVAYFSASGVTAGKARALAELTGSELYEIQPEEAYTRADLDWTNKKSRSFVEMHDPDSRPALAERIADVSPYDVVYIGFPIWWGGSSSRGQYFYGEQLFRRKGNCAFCNIRRKRH